MTSSGVSNSEALTVTELRTAAISGNSRWTSLVSPARTSTSPVSKDSPDSALTSSRRIPGRASRAGNRPDRSLSTHCPVPATQIRNALAGVRSLRAMLPRIVPVPTVFWPIAIIHQASAPPIGRPQRNSARAACEFHQRPLRPRTVTASSPNPTIRDPDIESHRKFRVNPHPCHAAPVRRPHSIVDPGEAFHVLATSVRVR